MGKIIETKITRFDKGITNIVRHPDTAYSHMVRHFDILTEPFKLSPFYGNVADGSTGDTEKLVKFIAGSDGVQYALGVVSGGAKVKIFERTPPTGVWGASTTGEDSGGARSETTFVNYKDIIYGFTASNRVWGYAYLTDTFTSTSLSISSTYTNTTPQGLVHSKDDILYLGFENIVIKKNGGAVTANWTDPALTLPSDQIITDMCEYGNYLAIATKSKRVGGGSIVYLWDRDSTLTTLSEKIDFGTGDLELIEEVDGTLVGVVKTAPSSLTINSKVTIRVWTGGSGAKKLLELPSSTLTFYFGGKQKVDNRMLFGMAINLDSINLDGVWSLGKGLDGQFALSLDTVITDTPPTAANRIKGFQLLGNYMTIAYLDDDAVSDPYAIVRTGTGYNFTSVYETNKFNAGDSSLKKDLIGISVMTEPLDDSPAAQIVVKYRKNNETSYTTTMTHDTDASLSDSAVNIESSGAALPKDYKEIQFRLESTNGAVITGCSFQEEITGKRAYS
jgi:hypothetical protein